MVVASLQDIVVNLDADNIAGPGFVLDVLQRFGQLGVSGRRGNSYWECPQLWFPEYIGRYWEITSIYIYTYIGLCERGCVEQMMYDVWWCLLCFWVVRYKHSKALSNRKVPMWVNEHGCGWSTMDSPRFSVSGQWGIAPRRKWWSIG